MKNPTKSLAMGSAAFAVMLLLSACGTETGAPTATDPTPITTISAEPNQSQDPDMLQLNESLKETLGEKYSEAWIADNRLHVAVTDKAAEEVVNDAGAVAHLAKYSAKDLEAAIGKIMAWQREQGGDVAAAIHRYVPSGRDGTITLAVDAAQLETIKSALAADNVAGGITLLFEKSAGPASPANT